MKYQTFLKWLIPILLQLYGVQLNAQLNNAEYFFDTDPGVGNGTPINSLNVNAGLQYDSTLFSGSISVPSYLSPGYHNVYIRMANYNNNGSKEWSQCEVRKIKVLSTGQQISNAEYFFDADPGIGNGHPISISGNTDSSSFTGNVSTTGLMAGIHTLCIRAKDIEGHWGNYESRKLLILTSGQTITKAEYFFDNDPGIDNGLPLNLSGNSDSSNFTGNLNTVGLSTGFHNVYIRVKKTTGEWSQYETKKIYVLPNGESITKAEYFYDTDPGFGNGTQVILSGNTDSSSLALEANTIGLTPGLHQLCIRTQLISGQWSQYEVRRIKVMYDGNQIPKAEYFVDEDPGVGNGYPVNLTASGNDASVFAGGIYIDTNLTAGDHLLYVRSQDYNGHWGHVDSGIAFHDCVPSTQPVISTSSMNNCGSSDITLAITSGNLNSADKWYWYQNSCGGLLIDSGSQIVVSPLDTTSYFVRGEGACFTPATCTPITIEANPASTLHLNLFLQGYYEGANSMRPALFNEGVVDKTNITDSIIVELHDPVTHELIDQKTSILHTDGSVTSNFCPHLGDYEIAIKHRNTIETWSSIPVTLTNAVSNYDFTNSLSQAYGDNMIEVESGVFAFYSGDINQDENIDLLDAPIVESDINQFQFGYYSSDINGDGNVDLLDLPSLEENISHFIFSSHP